jgi:AraC-like DNA-binding protein
MTEPPLVPRGLLDPESARRHIDLQLRRPGPELAEIVEHYWFVRWDLREGVEHTEQTLPHPCTHLVAEEFGGMVYGLMRGRFARGLRGAGHVGAIKFRPAGFRPLLGRSMAWLVDRALPVAEAFGAGGEELCARLRAWDDVDGAVAAAERFLGSRVGSVDPELAALNALVARIQEDRSIVRAETAAAIAGVSLRTLQRQFADAIGVGPKWVIQRYRLHELADRLGSDAEADLAGLAAELGYADQAHLARDFRALVGRPPAAYARRQRC